MPTEAVGKEHIGTCYTRVTRMIAERMASWAHRKAADYAGLQPTDLDSVERHLQGSFSRHELLFTFTVQYIL